MTGYMGDSGYYMLLWIWRGEVGMRLQLNTTFKLETRIFMSKLAHNHTRPKSYVAVRIVNPPVCSTIHPCPGPPLKFLKDCV